MSEDMIVGCSVSWPGPYTPECNSCRDGLRPLLKWSAFNCTKMQIR